MKKEQYPLYLLLAIIIILGIYDLLYFTNIIAIPFKLLLIINIVVPFQFMMGAMITTFGNQNKPEEFAQRFLILTTFQLVTITGILLAVWWIAKPELKVFSFHFLGVFMSLKIIQSVLLVRLASWEVK